VERQDHGIDGVTSCENCTRSPTTASRARWWRRTRRNSWTSLTSRDPFTLSESVRRRSLYRDAPGTARAQTRAERARTAPPRAALRLNSPAFANRAPPALARHSRITESLHGVRGNLRARARPPAQSPRRSLPAALLNGPDLCARAQRSLRRRATLRSARDRLRPCKPA